MCDHYTLTTSNEHIKALCVSMLYLVEKIDRNEDQILQEQLKLTGIMSASNKINENLSRAID